MKISAEGLSKKFLKHYVLKNFNQVFDVQESYALLGANGSGKSTLMRMLSGMQTPTAGTIRYQDSSGKPIDSEKIYKHLAYCAPGMELPEEMTLAEFLKFHFALKPLLPQISAGEIPELIQLEKHKHKFLGDFSSGMKQRVKLAQAIFADAEIMLLDEPCTNMDAAGVALYRKLTEQHVLIRQNCLLIVASNDEREHDFCTVKIRVEDYK